MKNSRSRVRSGQPDLFEIAHLNVTTEEGRVLFSDLNICFSKERVALIGRNGVGKSALLQIIAGKREPESGRLTMHSEPHFIDQTLDQNPGSEEIHNTLLWYAEHMDTRKDLSEEFFAAGLRPIKEVLKEKNLSHGELRKLKLLRAKLINPELLLLDEPSNDLDEPGVHWLTSWLENWRGGLLVASHEPLLLKYFQHFFIVSETGCRYLFADYHTLMEELEKEELLSQKRYVRNLNRLIEAEEHTCHIARRRRRKKQYGRVSELGRATPKLRLNQKRDYAQVKHGRMKKVRDARLGEIREWTKSSRRSIKVDLDLILPVPVLPEIDEKAIVKLQAVSAVVLGRCLFENINLTQSRERLAVIGKNGSGKTTLLDIVLRKRSSLQGTVQSDLSRIGCIAQGGSDWMVGESLWSYLTLHCSNTNPEFLANVLISHKFPLALAQRPMNSLSPGERVRAALLCLYYKSPIVELLVLDEPTYSLDLTGQTALATSLKAWPGGLLVASHSTNFLSEIGIDSYLELG